MRYLIPTLFLATPALAHPAGMLHSHAADWAVPVAMVFIIAVALVARRQAIRANK